MKTILLVDDSVITRELLRAFLAGDEVEVLEASDGEEALALLGTRRPDLILSDLRMPRLDGLGLIRELRRRAGLADVPVVVLSSSADRAALQACLDAGAREVIQKPVAVRPLHAAVHRHGGFCVDAGADHAST
jgi:CheY-like chemotaxis protein